MNLQEQISRIKSMMGLLIESTEKINDGKVYSLITVFPNNPNIKELFDTKQKVKWETDEYLEAKDFTTTFVGPNDREYVIDLQSLSHMYDSIEDDVYEYSGQVMSDDIADLFWELGYHLQFKDTEEGMGITGLGDTSASAIFGVVINAVIDKIKKEKIEYLFLSAEEPSRQKLYARLVPIIAKKMGWKGQANNGKYYFLSKKNLN
jgi:hypothetical protein